VLAGGGVAVSGMGPRAAALVRSGRPEITHGIQSGDVTASSGIVWTRADRPSRMLVEVSTRSDFRNALTVRGPLLTPNTDFTGKVSLTGLPAGEDVHYRVRLADLHDGSLTSAPETGRFRTAPYTRRDVSFCWSGDLAGQGYGINPDIGGYYIFDRIKNVDPDFFLCNGDHWYADNPIAETMTLPASLGGGVYRSLTTPEKSEVAQTLAGYRGQHRYNLMDHNLRAMAAALPQVNQWDDHETHNNWFPHQILDDDRYTQKNVDVLSAFAKQALFEYLPITERKGDRIYRKIAYGPLLDVFVLDMRSFKGPNDTDDSPNGKGILGNQQLEWLKGSLASSTATWKVVANDTPLGLIVPDGDHNFEGISQGSADKRPLGREIEIAGLLSFIKRQHVKNVVWITTDVHYTSAQYYDPSKATFQDFEPFWEFVSGPLNAGGFGPNVLDDTFGPQLKFKSDGGDPADPGVPPTNPKSQYFGEVAIDGRSEALTVRLRDATGTTGKVLFSVTLPKSH
jgi:alkaline phosphatase D